MFIAKLLIDYSSEINLCTCLTSRGSLVRIQYRPQLIIKTLWQFCFKVFFVMYTVLDTLNPCLRWSNGKAKLSQHRCLIVTYPLIDYLPIGKTGSIDSSLERNILCKSQNTKTFAWSIRIGQRWSGGRFFPINRINFVERIKKIFETTAECLRS